MMHEEISSALFVVSVKPDSQGTKPLARTFAEAGFVVLLHDQRRFGNRIEEWHQAARVP
jgi:hypothetical protein